MKPLMRGESKTLSKGWAKGKSFKMTNYIRREKLKAHLCYHERRGLIAKP